MSDSAAAVPTMDEVLARLSPEQKLETAFGLRETAWALVAAGVRMREPQLAEADVEDRVRAIFARAEP